MFKKLILLFFIIQFVNSLNFNVDFKLERSNDGINKLILKRDDKIIQEISIDIDQKHLDYSLVWDNFNNDNEKDCEQSKIYLKQVQNEEYYAIYRYSRILNKGTVNTDCVNLDSETTSWYGGPQQKRQYWPVEKLKLSNYSYLSKEADNAAVAERYWLSSKGVFIYVHADAPLYIDQNSSYPGQLCFRSEKVLPYDTRSPNYRIAYDIGIAIDSRKAHMAAIEHLLKKPTGYPDERMVRHPIWSTWARYKTQINESVVLEFADEILAYNFENSQYEIDDDWEICYGALEFNVKKFPNIKNLTDRLKAKGFRVTLWIHPFINKNCEPYFSNAKRDGYLVQDHNNNTDTRWWNSGPDESSYIDFTNPKAAKWFSDRLEKLQREGGIDSFKFDAGETSWSPSDPILRGPQELSPHQITIDYVKTVAKFGPMVEVRAGQSTQELPIFIRMIDKDSNWDFNNGLPTLVTTLLQLNMVGYPLVLPDMIGGNGYEGAPEKEMFIRWLAANVFMPSLQFSYVPWDYDNETVTISHKFTKLHDKFTDEIMKRFEMAVKYGDPVNPPLWWISPDDKVAQKIDDQFLLGDDIIVAPILNKGQLQRDIYLPSGKWLDGNSNNTVHDGPKTIKNYPAPIDIIPYFVRA